MPNKKHQKKSVKQKHNPLLFVAIAVAVVAIAMVFFPPSGKKGNTSGNQVADTTNKANTSDIADTSDTEETTGSSPENTASSDTAIPATLNEDGDVVIQIADITETATFYEYDANGTPMALFAVKASDGTIRTALDTCQVCNGSPYAYFTQQGDTFQCQNCGNVYDLDMIEQERGGCNPVPIMKDEKTTTDTEIIIPANLFEENADKFKNWKKF